METQKRLTFAGNIVICIDLFGDNEVWDNVVNVGGYIGANNRSEIESAVEKGKTV